MITIPLFLVGIAAANLVGAGSATAPEPESRLALLAAERLGDPYQLTPAESRLAKQRSKRLEAARATNADAYQAARDMERAVATMDAEVIDAGVSLTFDARSFGAREELSPATQRRLDVLIDFLNRHPERQLEMRTGLGAAAAGDRRGNARLIAARSAALKRYLGRAGIGDERLTFASIDVNSAPVERTAVQLVVTDSVIAR